MALYENRIKRKEKIRKAKNDMSTFFKFLFFFLKSRYLSLPDFSKEIRNLTHEQLENRVTEIRYYKHDYNDKYESLKYLHESYMKEQGLEIPYSHESFYGVYTMLGYDLNGYKDISLSIKTEEFNGQSEEYILIKKKEVV